LIGHRGPRLELAQPASEGPQELQPSRPGLRGTALALVATCPVGHALDGQWPAMVLLIHVSREADQGVASTACLEARAVTFGQERLYSLHEGGGAHRALPGHGSATAASLGWSSLA